MTESDDSERTSQDGISGARVVREDYENRVRHLANIAELGIRSEVVLETLLERSPPEALFWLEQLLRGAVWGRQDDFDVALGFVYWMVQNPRGDGHYAFFEQLYRLAYDHERDTLLYFLRNPPPQQELAEEAELPDVRLPLDRDEIPVGERRTIARRADRDTLERLIFDPEPLVIENLLDNPDLTETDVLKIAARRPTTPDILEKIVAHETWFGRPEVRKALVMNPYNETGLALKLLPTIGITALRRVRYGSDVHDALGDYAELLVELRESYTSPWEV